MIDKFKEYIIKTLNHEDTYYKYLNYFKFSCENPKYIKPVTDYINFFENNTKALSIKFCIQFSKPNDFVNKDVHDNYFHLFNPECIISEFIEEYKKSFDISNFYITHSFKQFNDTNSKDGAHSLKICFNIPIKDINFSEHDIILYKSMLKFYEKLWKGYSDYIDNQKTKSPTQGIGF